MTATRTRLWLLVAVVVSALVALSAPAPALASDTGRTTLVLAQGAGLDRPQGSARVRALQRRLRVAGVEPRPGDWRLGPVTGAAVRRGWVCVCSQPLDDDLRCGCGRRSRQLDHEDGLEEARSAERP